MTETLKKLTCFDMDNTLISSYMDNPNLDFHQWFVLPGRREKIAELLQEGQTIAIITNQAGVAFGYQTEKDVAQKIGSVAAELGLRSWSFYINLCIGHPDRPAPRRRRDFKKFPSWDPSRRKPNPDMLLEAMSFYALGPEHTHFVGDLYTDRLCAERAEVLFTYADDYFNSTTRVAQTSDGD